MPATSPATASGSSTPCREGVGKAWFAHRARRAGADRRSRCASGSAARRRCGVDGVRAKVDAAATEWVQEQLDRFRVEILNTTGRHARRLSRACASRRRHPEAVTVELRANERAATKDRERRRSARATRVTSSPTPTASSRSTSTTGSAGSSRPSSRGPASSPGTATRAARRRRRCGSPTRTTRSEWASLQPDFIVVSRRDDGSLAASIVDPHGDYLADARAKLRALADFAERFGDRFVRIESVAKADDGSLRVLDLGDPAVRAAVAGVRRRQGHRPLRVRARAAIPVNPSVAAASVGIQSATTGPIRDGWRSRACHARPPLALRG